MQELVKEVTLINHMNNINGFATVSVLLRHDTTPSQRGVTAADSFMANLAYNTCQILRRAWSCCTNDALHRCSIHNSQLTVVHVTYYGQYNVDSWPVR